MIACPNTENKRLRHCLNFKKAKLFIESINEIRQKLLIKKVGASTETELSDRLVNDFLYICQQWF